MKAAHRKRRSWSRPLIPVALLAAGTAMVALSAANPAAAQPDAVSQPAAKTAPAAVTVQPGWRIRQRPPAAPLTARAMTNQALTVYANPLRAVSGLVAQRIDQGVDFYGTGPIYSPGPGVVVNVYNGGWPGGAFIVIRLTGGTRAGMLAYSAENITPSVAIGQAVDSSTVIGTVTGGIELGWASPVIGNSLARQDGQGAFPTGWGLDYRAFLTSLGAP